MLQLENERNVLFQEVAGLRSWLNAEKPKFAFLVLTVLEMASAWPTFGVLVRSVSV